jgi:hypothetical protein
MANQKVGPVISAFVSAYTAYTVFFFCICNGTSDTFYAVSIWRPLSYSTPDIVAKVNRMVGDRRTEKVKLLAHVQVLDIPHQFYQYCRDGSWWRHQVEIQLFGFTSISSGVITRWAWVSVQFLSILKNSLLHYVYPCQRFSTGNTLEDYNPQSKCQQSFPLILITKKGVNLSSCVLVKPTRLLSIIICLFKR